MSEIGYRERRFNEGDLQVEEPEEDYGSSVIRTVPCFIEKPQRCQLREGFDAVIACKVSGNPLPNVRVHEITSEVNVNILNFLLQLCGLDIGAWWLSGRFGALCAEGRRFEFHSSRHVGTLSKSFTNSCL